MITVPALVVLCCVITMIMCLMTIIAAMITIMTIMTTHHSELFAWWQHWLGFIDGKRLPCRQRCCCHQRQLAHNLLVTNACPLGLVLLLLLDQVQLLLAEHLQLLLLVADCWRVFRGIPGMQ